jgi:hypothetical protein
MQIHQRSNLLTRKLLEVGIMKNVCVWLSAS